MTVHESHNDPILIGKTSRAEWNASSGYHRRSLADTLMYRLMTLTGHSLSYKRIEKGRFIALR